MAVNTHRWPVWIVNTQTSSASGSHWFAVALAKRGLGACAEVIATEQTEHTAAASSEAAECDGRGNSADVNATEQTQCKAAASSHGEDSLGVMEELKQLFPKLKLWQMQIIEDTAGSDASAASKRWLERARLWNDKVKSGATRAQRREICKRTSVT